MARGPSEELAASEDMFDPPNKGEAAIWEQMYSGAHREQEPQVLVHGAASWCVLTGVVWQQGVPSDEAGVSEQMARGAHTEHQSQQVCLHTATWLRAVLLAEQGVCGQTLEGAFWGKMSIGAHEERVASQVARPPTLRPPMPHSVTPHRVCPAACVQPPSQPLRPAIAARAAAVAGQWGRHLRLQRFRALRGHVRSAAHCPQTAGPQRAPQAAQHLPEP